MKLLYTIIICFLPLYHYSQMIQGINPDPYQNTIIQKHYSTSELNEIQQDTAKWNAMIYYYTESFIFEQVECDECLPFDPSKFDITEFEHLRKKQSRIKKKTKYGMLVTLLSVDELEYKLPIHAPQIPNEDE